MKEQSSHNITPVDNYVFVHVKSYLQFCVYEVNLCVLNYRVQDISKPHKTTGVVSDTIF